MKTLLQTLFFFLLATQICFTQWLPVGLENKSIKDIAVRNSTIFAITSDNCYGNGQGINCSGRVFRSVDNGANWTMIVDSNAIDVAISPSGKLFMIRDQTWWSDSLYYSLDNGNTWTSINILEQLIDSIPVGDPQNITISPEGVIYCGIHWPGWGTGDVLAKSTDDGLTWTTPGEGVLSGKLYDFRGQFVITVGEFRCISTCPFWWDMHLSSDYGNTWEPLVENSVSADPQVVTRFSNGNIMIDEDNLGSSSPSGIYLSNDMCSTWIQISSIDCQVGLSLPSGFSEGILIGTDSLGVFLFSDEGDSLGPRNEGLMLSLDIRALTLDNNGLVYAGLGRNMMVGSGGLWRRPLSEIIPVELKSFTATSNISEVTLSWSTATETNNSGFGIERKPANSEYSEIGFIPGYGTTTENKSYTYTDSKVSAGIYTYRLKQIDFDGSYEYSPEVEVLVPAAFSLDQNYPNPFNPETIISFQLPAEGKVILKIYDILGNEIEILINEEKPAGNYKVTWRAADLPSGVYFYQLRAGNFVQTKKMILLR